MSKQKEKKLNKAIELISQEYKPEKIILYGSYATGNSKPWSDIDLLIIKKTDRKSTDRIGDVLNIIHKDRDNWCLGVEPIVCTPKEYKEALDGGDFFIHKVCQTGKILYEKQ